MDSAVVYLLVLQLGAFGSEYKRRPFNNLGTAWVHKMQCFRHPSDVGILCFRTHDFSSGQYELIRKPFVTLTFSLEFAVLLSDTTHIPRLRLEVNPLLLNSSVSL